MQVNEDLESLLPMEGILFKAHPRQSNIKGTQLETSSRGVIFPETDLASTAAARMAIRFLKFIQTFISLLSQGLPSLKVQPWGQSLAMGFFSDVSMLFLRLMVSLDSLNKKSNKGYGPHVLVP